MWPFPPRPHTEERPGQGPEWALPEARGLLWHLDTEKPKTPISLRRGLQEAREAPFVPRTLKIPLSDGCSQRHVGGSGLFR